MSYKRNRNTTSTDDVEIYGAVEEGVTPKAGGIEVDTDRVLKTQDLDREKFMNQEITIFLGEPQSENEPHIVEVTVNGDYRMGVRGHEMKLKRSHLEVLAQAKQSRVRQRLVHSPDGSQSFKEENVLQLTYPFQVIHDPDMRKGGPWLRQLLSNPA